MAAKNSDSKEPDDGSRLSNENVNDKSEPVLSNNAREKRKCASDDHGSEKIRKINPAMNKKQNSSDSQEKEQTDSAMEACSMDAESDDTLSDTSHHSRNINSGQSADSSDEDKSSNDWKTVKKSKKKKRSSGCHSEMTSDLNISSRYYPEDTSVMFQKTLSKTKSSEFTVRNTATDKSRDSDSAASTIATTSASTQAKQRYRMTAPKQKFPDTSTLPTFVEHPVIVTDAETTQSVRLHSLEWKLTDILKNAVGAVKSIKELKQGKFLIGCYSQHQQQRLSNMASIGGIKVSCTVPVPTVHGVVRGIPTWVTEKDIVERIESILDGEARVTKARVRNVKRLSLRDGNPSRAVHITFEAATLPDMIVINKVEYPVLPFGASVPRCYHCQKLGHMKKSCPSKAVVCSTCASRGHTADQCTSERRICANCKGDHSSAYGGCPALKQWSLANRLRSKTYMPLAQAFYKAKNILAEKSASKEETTGQNSAPSDAWRPERQSPPGSFAAVTAGLSRQLKASPKLHNEDQNRTSATKQSNVVAATLTHDDDDASRPTSVADKLQEENKSLRADLKIMSEKVTSLLDTVDKLTKELELLRKGNESSSCLLRSPFDEHSPSLSSPSQIDPRLAEHINLCVIKAVQAALTGPQLSRLLHTSNHGI